MSKARRILAGLAALGVVACASALVSLRSARPLYYSDGTNAASAFDLSDASMLRFGTPTPGHELPGPIQGRAAQLPDGRWIYGLRLDDGTTDLVLYDPKRPDDEPEKALALNSTGHDLAPALHPDGRLLFASDRAGGTGGFDLYEARIVSGGFAGLRLLGHHINTEQDETDPAPHPHDDRVVFVRRDPRRNGGSNGRLMIAVGKDDAVPLFKGDEPRPGASPRIDRDPAWSPDARRLCFVRQQDGRVKLLQTWEHPSSFGEVNGFVDALPVSGLEALAQSLRGPEPSADGRTLRLLDPKAGLVYESRSEELVPWWRGQLELELFLLWLLAFFALMFLSMALAGRWKALDIITQCLLLSMLLHLLLLLWFMGVKIDRSFVPPPREPGDAIAVRLVSSSEFVSEEEASADSAPSVSPITARVQRQFDKAEIAHAAPSTATQRNERAGPSAAERAEFAEARESETVADLADAADPTKLREGVDKDAKVAAAETKQSAPDKAIAAAERSVENAPSFSTARPQSVASRESVAAARAKRGERASKSAAHRAELQRQDVARPETALADAAEAIKTRSGSDAASPKLRASQARLARSSKAEASRAERAAPSDRAIASAARPNSATPTASGSAARVAAAAKGDRRAQRMAPGRALNVDPALADAVEERRAVAGRDAPSQAIARTNTVARQANDSSSPLRERASRTDAARRDSAALDTPESQLAPRVRGRQTPRTSRDAATVKVGPRELRVSEDAVAMRDSASADSKRVARAGRDEARKLQAASSEARPDATGITTARGPAREVRSGRPSQSPRPESNLARVSRRGSRAARRATPRAAPKSALRSPALAFADRVESRPVAARTSSKAKADAAASLAKAAPLAIEPRSALPGGRRAEREPRTPGTIPAAESRLARASRRAARSRRTPRTMRTPSRAVAPKLRGAIADAARPDALRALPEPKADPATAPLSAMRFAAKSGASSRAIERPRPRADKRPSQRSGRALAARPESLIARAPRRGIVRARPTEAPAVKASLYANRFGERKAKALERFGGTRETERAVQKGLAYLARIQQPDGAWGEASAWDRKYGEVRVGKAGLCLLAFLGAGHTHQSNTEYSRHVRRTLQYLLGKQGRRSGHFGMTSSYSHGITAYALAECYALTKDESLREPLESAVEWILDQQDTRGPRHSRGGWGYFSPRLQREDGYARASTSAWQIMALESARRSGIDVPDESLALARRFLLQLFDRRGYFLYNREPGRLRSRWRTLPASTPASAFCLMLLGVKSQDRRLQSAMEYTVSRRPTVYRKVSDDEFVLRARGNVYFWYYGTLASFFAGGEHWRKWNEALKTLLPRAQSEDGSFRPIDPYSRYAKESDEDRSYTTAMCVLSLEIYYRYFTPLLEKR